MKETRLLIRLFFALLLVVNLSSPLLADLQLKPDPMAILPVEELTIKSSAGEFTFTVEIADETHERARGLMQRKEMLVTHGMLFDFEQTSPVMMWMENTPLSLDMIFITKDGVVSRIERNTKPFSRDIISSRTPVSHVLELNAGTAFRIGLKPGDQIFHRMFKNATAQ